MLRSMLLALGLATLLASPGRAHDVRSTVILLDVGSKKVDAEIQIPVQELQGAFRLQPTWRGPVTGFASSSQLEHYVGAHVGATTATGAPFDFVVHDVGLRRVEDGDAVVAHATLIAPPPGSARTFELRVDLVVHEVVTHNILVFLRHDALGGVLEQKPELLGMMHFQNKTLRIDRSQGSLMQGFRATFALGLRHIAEGTDHLLFLLVLLLPASLVVVGRRWSGPATLRESALRIVKVVSAFTLGHSLTLVLGAWELAWIPTRAVEIAIAASILISAVHAATPLFSGREPWISGGFGLVHGMAFASVLQGLAVDGPTLAVSVLGFNLGIEVMQLTVVAVTMPWLFLLSRRRHYVYVRLGGALLAAIAAVGWIGQRALGLDTPLSRMADLLAHYGSCLVGALALIALATCATRTSDQATTSPAPPA